MILESTTCWYRWVEKDLQTRGNYSKVTREEVHLHFQYLTSSSCRTNNIGKINYPFEATSIAASKSSYLGGEEISIHGKGFGNTADSLKVKFGDAVCKVTAVTDTKITCVSGQAAKIHKIDNGGVHEGTL